MLNIRVDDFPGTRPNEFDKHNLESFKQFHDVMQKYKLRYSLGVIPFHTSDDDLRWLRDQNDIHVSLHGVVHDETQMNEFLPFLTKDEVVVDLRIARDRMESILGYNISSYIPPHNVIDPRTCVALKELHFERVLCGPGTEYSVMEFARNIHLDCHYSSAPLEYGRSDELLARGSAQHLRSISKDNNVWLTLHWTWEKNIGLDHLNQYLKELFK